MTSIWEVFSYLLPPQPGISLKLEYLKKIPERQELGYSSKLGLGEKLRVVARDPAQRPKEMTWSPRLIGKKGKVRATGGGSSRYRPCAGRSSGRKTNLYHKGLSRVSVLQEPQDGLDRVEACPVWTHGWWIKSSNEDSAMVDSYDPCTEGSGSRRLENSRL